MIEGKNRLCLMPGMNEIRLATRPGLCALATPEWETPGDAFRRSAARGGRVSRNHPEPLSNLGRPQTCWGCA